ncbi:hypothetical protein BKA64DRAFT_674681 [Cadophora sp. MPI-SDFR-AT-0126]|nr:hypothetical protein BKA64DRAFT_674681 [Leotiomycetes sp. MPI-SDFR-AT-0126]
MLGPCQENSSSVQCCSVPNEVCCSSCEIDFREYIRLFDESIEYASCLQDRIATLESLVRDGGKVSPDRLDNFVQLTEEINRLHRQLDGANSDISPLNVAPKDGLPHHQGAPGESNADFTRLLAPIAELEAQNTTLEEELEDSFNQIPDIETEKWLINNEAYDHPKIDSEEVGDLQEEMDSLRRQVTSLGHGSRDDIIQQLDKELSECRKEKERATTESLLVQHSHQHLQGDFDAAQAEVTRLQEVIKGMRQNPPFSVDADEIARLTAALAECQNQRNKDALEIVHLDDLLVESTQQQEELSPNPEVVPSQASYANSDIARLNKKSTEALSNSVKAKRENLASQDSFDESEANRSVPDSNNINIAAISARANRVPGLEDKIKESEKTIALLQARIAGDRNAGHQAEIDQLNDRIQELTGFLEETEKDLAELQEEHAEQTAAFESLAPEITTLEAQRDQAEADLERELQAGGNNVAELEVKINELQEQLDQCNKARKKPATDTGSARLRKQVKDLTAERDDLQEQLDSVGQDPEQVTTVKWLRGKRAYLQKELENAKRDLKRRDNAIANAETEVIRLENALYEAEETVERIRGERTKAREQRDDARKRLQDCETGGSSHAQVEALRAEVAEYKSAAAASDRAQGASEIEMEKLQRARDKALTERDAARRERDEGRGRSPSGIQNLMSRIAELERELEKSTESQQEAEDQFAEEKSVLRNKIRELETSLTNTQKLLDANRQTTRDTEDESMRKLEHLKLQLQNERDSAQRLQEELIAAHADGDLPESDRNAALVRQLNFAGTRLRAREQLINDMDNRLSSPASSKNVEAAELRRQLVVAQAEILRLNVDPTPDQEELAFLRQENDDLNTRLEDLEDARRRLRNEQAETERLRISIRELCLKVEEGRCCEKAREASGWKIAGNSADEYLESERESRLATIATLEEDLKESHRVIANLSITLERNTRDSERQTSENLMNLAAARAQIASLTTQLENLSPETDAHLWQKINDCNNEVELKEKLIQEQRDDVADLQLKVEHAQTEVFRLRDEIAHLEKTNVDLEKQLSNNLHGKKRRNAQVSSTIKTEFEKDEEIQELQEKLARMEAQLKSKRRTNRDPRAKFTEYGDDDELEETMVENQRLRDLRDKERKALVTKNRTLREQLKVAESKVAEMTTFIDEDLQNESGLGDDAALRRLIATLKEHNKRLQKELDDWKNNDILKDRQSQIAKLGLEIEDLHFKLASKEATQDASSGQIQSSQMSTDEKNGYIEESETWQQRVVELEEMIEALKEEIVSLEEENIRLAEDLKIKVDFLDKVMNTVDNFKEEVQAIEKGEVDPDQPYGNASEASTEIITERPRADRDALPPAEERRQSREFVRRPTASSIRRRSSRQAAEDKLGTTQGKRASGLVPATTDPEPEPKTRRSRRTLRSIPEEPAEPEKRTTRSSKRKTLTTETSAKQPKAPAKKRKLR